MMHEITLALRIRLQGLFGSWRSAKHQERYPNLDNELVYQRLKTFQPLLIESLNHEDESGIACLSVDRQIQKRRTRSRSKQLN